MPPLPSFASDLLEKWSQLLTYLSALTLGEIWRAIYNPPSRFNLSLLAIAVAIRVPEYYHRYQVWRASKRVVRFYWPLPKVSLRVDCDRPGEGADGIASGRRVDRPGD